MIAVLLLLSEEGAGVAVGVFEADSVVEGDTKVTLVDAAIDD
jgi:hypothetical protein